MLLEQHAFLALFASRDGGSEKPSSSPRKPAWPLEGPAKMAGVYFFSEAPDMCEHGIVVKSGTDRVAFQKKRERCK